MIKDEGITLEGEFKNGLRNGYGTFTTSNGEKYEGEWKDNYKHGKGVQDFSDDLPKMRNILGRRDCPN